MGKRTSRAEREGLGLPSRLAGWLLFIPFPQLFNNY